MQTHTCAVNITHFLPSFLLSCSKILVTCSRACLPACQCFVKKKEIGFGCNWPMNPSFPCGSRIESAESAVSGTNPEQIVPHLPAFSASLFSPSSVCQDPSLLWTSRMVKISRWSIPAHILLKKKKGQSRRQKWWRKKRKRKEGTKVKKLKLFFLFSFFLLLPFSIVFVAAGNIMKELSSLPFVFVCLFVFSFLVVWVSNSAGQSVPLL